MLQYHYECSFGGELEYIIEVTHSFFSQGQFVDVMDGLSVIGSLPIGWVEE